MPPAVPPASAPPPGLAPFGFAEPGQADGPGQPSDPSDPSGPAGRKPSAGLLLIVVGTVLAVLLGAFVVWQFVWPRGGAGSPEAAVEKFIQAGVDQDPIALLDVIAPDEVDALEDVIKRALERAEDEELTNGDGLTDAVQVELTDLEFETDELGDDLARVAVVDGSYDVSWDPDDLPERLSFLEDESGDESESGDLSELFEEEWGDDEPFLTTVKVGGRWYVTLLGSVAELAYDVADDEVDDLETPDYDLLSEDLEPITGDTPEDVVEGIAEAISDSDGETLIASLPGDLGRPLRPYVALVEDALNGRYGDDAVSADVEVSDLDLEQEDIGDGRVKVTVKGARVVATGYEDDYSETVEIEIDGKCVTGTGDGFATYDYVDGGNYDEYGYYEDDGGYDEYGNFVGYADEELVSESETWCFGNDDEFADVVRDLDIDQYFVVMQEVDGGYQLDPLATAAEYATLALDALDEDLVEDLLDRWEDEL
ncbi:hypothetical protein GCM10025786_29310 [Nocardioides caeni]